MARTVDPLPAAAPVAVLTEESLAPVMAAIAALDAKIDRALTNDTRQIDGIQAEIADISGRIRATKAEIASLRHPLAGEDKLTEASEELGAVVAQTENATNAIMNCAERIDEIVAEVRSQLPPGYAAERLHEVAEIVVRLYEACNFQDLTGQRIGKVVRALNFVEARVDSMLKTWNVREFETMPLPPSLARVDDGLELLGPARDQQSGSISQADIDALFK